MEERKAAVKRLTKTVVEALPRPAKGGRSVLWDTELKGFGVRVTGTGARTYILRYRLGGRETPLRTETIGRHGSPWTTDQARRRAGELLGQVRLGVDHSAVRAAKREEAADATTKREERMFAKLADRWFRQHVKRGGLRSEKDIKGVLERDLKPAFATCSVDEITKESIAEMLDAIGERSPDAANKAFKWLRQMFNWFIEVGVVRISPADRMKMPFPEGKRTRTLSLAEVVVVWVALDALPDPFRSFYRLLILLGQRLREVSNLPWSEVDMEAADWIIPAARTKNKRPHLVPLPDQAVDILTTLEPEEKIRRGPAISTDGKVGISGFSKLKERLDEEVAKLIARSPTAAALIAAEQLPEWVVHDLRRTLATGCQGLGIAIPITEATLNHVSGSTAGIVGVYQLYDYYDEKADALQRWADLIEAAVARFRADDAEGVLALDPSRRKRRIRRRPTLNDIPPDTSD